MRAIADATRAAWSGMSYWGYYAPSKLRGGTLAYCITDQPVYRPQQTVRFKVWVRQMQEGELRNLPNRHVGITVVDPRGDKVHEIGKPADAFGGIDGEFTLVSESALGVYRIHVHGHSYAGGQNFRVEEYKKPEFEITIEPDSTHTKLGKTLTARIKASYYFGNPVIQATLIYKVFLEEYTHTYRFPG